MPLSVKNGKKIALFLKDNIPTNKEFFTEREVWVTLQGSKTGKETKVKLKIKAGKRKFPLQSSSGALRLNEFGNYIPALSTKLPEINKQEIKRKIADKIKRLEDERIAPPTKEEVQAIVEEEEIKEIVKEVAKKTGKTIQEAADEIIPRGSDKTIVDEIEDEESDPLAGTGITPGQFSGLVNTSTLKNLSKGGLNLGNLGNASKNPSFKKKKKGRRGRGRDRG